MKKNSFSPDSFFDGLYTTYSSPFENVQSGDECLAVCADVKSRLAEALAIDKILIDVANLKTWYLALYDFNLLNFSYNYFLFLDKRFW